MPDLVPISEWVLAVMLAHEKRLPDAWIHEPPEHWSWKELGGLHGRTLGLVGLGGIGSAIATRAAAFGMDIRAVRRTAAPSPVRGVTVVTSLDELLARADHLVLAAPSTPEDRVPHRSSRADAGEAGCAPREHRPRRARRPGRVARSARRRTGLDGEPRCVRPEPLPAGHWMYAHPKVRLSPHISWSNPDLGGRIVELVVDNVRRYVAGEPLQGIVDPVERY